MTRAGDIAPPAVTPHPLPPGAPTARWQGRLVIALERLPQAAYVWDDVNDAVVWDAPGDPYVWDAPFVGSGYTDAFCDFQALTFGTGDPDEDGLYPAGELNLSLANPHGEYTTRNVDGRLVYYAPGRKVCVFWNDAAGASWWLWSGRVARWDEQADGSVQIQAFTPSASLAADPGRSWTPGAAGQFPSQRFGSVLPVFGYTDPTRLDVGTVTLSSTATTNPPLEHLQRVALSDGGVVVTDADGALLYRDRGWRTGRTDQPVPIPMFTDNKCDTGALVVWDLELSNTDDTLATSVVLTNEAAVTVTSTLPADSDAWYGGGAVLRYTHQDPDLWQVTADGQRLADFILADRSRPVPAVGGFDLHLLDPKQPALWATACKLRIGDRLELVRDYVAAGGVPAALDVTAVVASLRHDIAPDDGWRVHVTTARAVTYTTPQDWDVTVYTWDDPDPANAWSP